MIHGTIYGFLSKIQQNLLWFDVHCNQKHSFQIQCVIFFMAKIIITRKKSYLTVMTCKTPVTFGDRMLWSGTPIGDTVPRTIAYGIFLSFFDPTYSMRLLSIFNCGASWKTKPTEIHHISNLHQKSNLLLTPESYFCDCDNSLGIIQIWEHQSLIWLPLVNNPFLCCYSFFVSMFLLFTKDSSKFWG